MTSKTWVGRSIRRVEDPALVAGLGRFTGDLAGQALGAFRAKPGGVRQDQEHQGAAGCDGDRHA